MAKLKRKPLRSWLRKVLFGKTATFMHDQQAGFTFSNSSPKTKAPLNAQH